MVFTFYKARGLGVGNSLVEEDKLELAAKLEKMAKEKVGAREFDRRLTGV
jgi:phosphoglycerate kinase